MNLVSDATIAIYASVALIFNLIENNVTFEDDYRIGKSNITKSIM